jgi:hypothetical protein
MQTTQPNHEDPFFLNTVLVLVFLFVNRNYKNMKPSDLRIGNLVTVNNTKHWPLLKDVPLSIEGVNKCKPLEDVENTDYGVQLFDNSDYKTRYSHTKTFSQFLCFIEPIKLTEEWLIKLGFYKSSGENPHFTKGNTLLIFKTNYESESIEDYYHFEFGITKSFGAIREIRLNYVHQLQNLASDLNEELVLQD